MQEDAVALNAVIKLSHLKSSDPSQCHSEKHDSPSQDLMKLDLPTQVRRTCMSQECIKISHEGQVPDKD